MSITFGRGGREKGHRAPHWTAAELIRLRALYPRSTWDELLAAFPGRSKLALELMARKRKFYRVRTPLVATGSELIDDIRSRARELKITMLDLDVACKSPGFFSQNHCKHKAYINVKVIDRALRALGGRMHVVWEER